MTEYSKILEHIKASETRVASVSKEIKDIEAEIKTLDGKIEVMRAKEKQRKEEISYNKKCINEKDWEIRSLKRRHEIWTTMLEEKRNLFETKTEELEKMQQKVWDTRISFHDDTMDFLSKNDYLFNSDVIERVIEKQQERKKLTECVNNLENNVKEIENKHSEIKQRYDLLTNLEKEKEMLLEYERSPEIISIQNKIHSYNKELQNLELELSKYKDRTVNHSHVVKIQKMEHCNERGESSIVKCKVLEQKDNICEVQEGIPDYQIKRKFKPKAPSILLKKHSMEE